MKFIRKHASTILILAVFLIGICFLTYPTVSNWWNSNIASRAVSNYSDIVGSMNSAQYDEILTSAREYNKNLIFNPGRLFPNENEHQDYLEQLNINGSEVMGAIEIPSIKVSLPIYHGTSDDILAGGAGHLEGSSLPIGGLGTHAVITGHRGLPSAKLFTDLDQLAEGDYLMIKVLDETLTYEVEKIRIVLPTEINELKIEPEKDLVTLVTCTPYGVNTHRILITGHRVENISEWEAVSDAGQIDTKMVALFIAIPILAGLFIWLMVYYRKPRGDSDEEDKNNSNQ